MYVCMYVCMYVAALAQARNSTVRQHVARAMECPRWSRHKRKAAAQDEAAQDAVVDPLPSPTSLPVPDEPAKDEDEDEPAEVPPKDEPAKDEDEDEDAVVDPYDAAQEDDNDDDDDDELRAKLSAVVDDAVVDDYAADDDELRGVLSAVADDDEDDHAVDVDVTTPEEEREQEQEEQEEEREPASGSRRRRGGGGGPWRQPRGSVGRLLPGPLSTLQKVTPAQREDLLEAMAKAKNQEEQATRST